MILCNLDNVQPGDKVLQRTTYYKTVLQVTRVTPSMIFCGDFKFRKRDGQQVPKDTYGYSEIEPLTPEKEEQLHEEQIRQEYVEVIRMAPLFNLPLNVLKDFAEKIEEYYANVEKNR